METIIFRLRTVVSFDYVLIYNSVLIVCVYIKQEEKYFNIKDIKAGVPQGSVACLYLLYTSDIPQVENVIIATFTDDTAVLLVGNNSNKASNKLQEAATD